MSTTTVMTPGGELAKVDLKRTPAYLLLRPGAPVKDLLWAYVQGIPAGCRQSMMTVAKQLHATVPALSDMDLSSLYAEVRRAKQKFVAAGHMVELEAGEGKALFTVVNLQALQTKPVVGALDRFMGMFSITGE